MKTIGFHIGRIGFYRTPFWFSTPPTNPAPFPMRTAVCSALPASLRRLPAFHTMP